MLSNVIPGLTLSTDGGVTPDVYAGVPSGGTASTGTLGFVSIVSSTWTPTLRLRADFAFPTHIVSIDMIGNDSAETGSLEAYDSSGTLLDVYNASTIGDGAVETMTVVSPTVDIAYVIAGGTNGNTVDLDNLQFDGGGEPSTTTDPDGNYSFIDLSVGNYDVAEVHQPGWVQTFPQSGNVHTVAVGPGQAVPDVNFGNQYLAPPLLGDYNQNGIVDSADYNVWRNTLGQTGVAFYSGADGSGNGVIDKADYSVWKAHFGDILAGAGGGGSIVAEVKPQAVGVLNTAGQSNSGTRAESLAVARGPSDSPAGVGELNSTELVEVSRVEPAADVSFGVPDLRFQPSRGDVARPRRIAATMPFAQHAR